MFKRLVAAVDQSAVSRALVEAVGHMALLGTREVLLLHCVTINDLTSISLSYTLEYLDRNLKELKTELSRHGIDVKTRIVPGSPRSEIFHVAINEGYGVIVVGAKKHAAVEPLFGGLAFDLIHQAPKPVLIVRLKEDAPAPANLTRHVLLPTDFSENAAQAGEAVLTLIKQGAARRVTLLHVQDQSRIGKALQDKLGEYNAIDGQRLDGLKRKLEAEGAEVDTLIRFGSPSVETLKTIQELSVTLVVMGSQGRGFVPELFLGSVSHNVARHGDASVLLIPAKKHLVP
jgi:nucleotide-binding universal stress UspA family protein